MSYSRLWVNPEGVSAVGGAYEEHVAQYNAYVNHLLSLRSRYANAWGDDDMGKEFSTKFLKGMDNLEALIDGIKGTLAYTAEGLRASGKMYREVDDNATEATESLARDFEDFENPTGARYANAQVTEGQVTAPLQPKEPQQSQLFSMPAGRQKILAPGEEVAAERQGRLQPTIPGRLPLADGEDEPQFLRAMAVKGRTLGRADDVEGEVTEPLMAARVVRGKHLQPGEDPLVEGESPAFVASARRMAVGERIPGVEPLTRLEPMQALERRQGELLTPLQPTQVGVPMQRGVLPQDELFTPLEPTHSLLPASKLEPAMPAMPATPAMPAISSMMLQPEFFTAYVGGEPLPEGYRLQAFNPIDGNTRVDANMYESVTPLGNSPVTTPDGQPIDGQGRHLFVVKDNPAVDPTAPDYQPLVMSYAPDGTPSVLY